MPSNPEPPTGLIADEVTDSSARISWDAVDYAEGIKEYEIYRNNTSVGTRVGTTFADSGLTSETTYDYQVKAIGNNDLESELSETLTVTTEAVDEEPEDPEEGD